MIRTLLAAALAAASVSPAAAETLAFTHARIHTVGPAGTLEDATLVVRNGVIEAVAARLVPPADAKVVDVKGAVITPGLIAPYTHLGLVEIEQIEETVDTGSDNPRYGAALDVADALNPRSTHIPVQRLEGVTQAIAAPVSGGDGPLLAGRGAAINLAVGEPFVARPLVAMFAALGEAGAARVKGGRAGLMLALREAFDEAKNPGGNVNIQRPAQLSALDAAALAPVLAGELPLVATVHRAADITALLKLCAEYGVKPVIHGGAEAHLVAPQLVAARVPVILDPTLNLPQQFESRGASADAAARLHRAGVRLSFASQDVGYASSNARNLRQLAGNAVAQGLPWNAALAAITLDAAAIYGLDNTLGSLEAGKAATFVVWSGDPLEVTSAATAVYAEGRAQPLTSRQTLLRERYRKPRS
jgi:imidazolonepropionase-like amidohydrolase